MVARIYAESPEVRADHDRVGAGENLTMATNERVISKDVPLGADLLASTRTPARVARRGHVVAKTSASQDSLKIAAECAESRTSTAPCLFLLFFLPAPSRRAPRGQPDHRRCLFNEVRRRARPFDRHTTFFRVSPEAAAVRSLFFEARDASTKAAPYRRPKYCCGSDAMYWGASMMLAQPPRSADGDRARLYVAPSGREVALGAPRSTPPCAGRSSTFPTSSTRASPPAPTATSSPLVGSPPKHAEAAAGWCKQERVARVVALNSSRRKSRGGFLGGATAQEEDWRVTPRSIRACARQRTYIRASTAHVVCSTPTT